MEEEQGGKKRADVNAMCDLLATVPINESACRKGLNRGGKVRRVGRVERTRKEINGDRSPEQDQSSAQISPTDVRHYTPSNP